MNRLDSSTKRRRWKYLSKRQRYDIELLLKEGYKPKQIAQTLQRDRRTIERGINNPDASVGVVDSPCSYNYYA